MAMDEDEDQIHGEDSKAMLRLCRATAADMSSGAISDRASRCHNISAQGPNQLGYTPLHIGAVRGSLDAMKTLIHLGARVNAPAHSSATPLHLAVQSGQLGAVRLLVSRSADLEARDWLGKTALHHACDYARMNGLDSTTACCLVRAGANVHRRDCCRNTPATLAIRMDNHDLIMVMLRRGSKPSQDAAYTYAAECRGSTARDELLGILVEYGWAPSPPGSNGGNSGGGGTANDSAPRSERTAGSARSRDYYNDEREQLGEDSPLHEAVLLGDDERHLTVLLETGEDPNVLNSSGCSPLAVAAWNGDVGKVEVLLGAGAALDLKIPQNGFTALHLSAAGGHTEVTTVMVAFALSNNRESTTSSLSARDIAPCSSVMERGASLSSRAAAANAKETCSLPAVLDMMDGLGNRPLHIAAFHNNVQVMEVLLGAGADVDSRNKRGGTPLLSAAKEDNVEAVMALLKAGASPDVKDSGGNAALHMAMLRPAGAVVEALLVGGASPGLGGERGPTPLHIACESNARGTVEALLRAGALPGHCLNDLRESPLMVACKNGSLNAVKLLLPRLSVRHINMRSRMFGVYEGGDTALVAAICYYCFDESEILGIVEALLEAGADPTLTACTHAAPIAAVVQGDNTKHSPTLGPSLIRALVAAGADVNGIGIPSGFAPLHLACFEGACREVVQALLDAGADPCMPCGGSMERAGMHFMSPLQLAGAGGNVEAVKLLIRHPLSGGLNAVGAAPARATVLACAIQHGKTEVCRFLLEEGADMDLLPSSSNATSLVEMAAQHGHLDAMRLLIQAKVFKDQAEQAEEARVRGGVKPAGEG